MNRAYDAYVKRTMNAWKAEDDEETRIVPDGHIIRVSLVAMDSVQRQMANQSAFAFDERVRDNIAANQATLDASQRAADRAQGFADAYAARRAASERENAGPYADFCKQVSDAWQVAA